MKKRVTGLGGVFFKTPDPKKIRDWYAKHLGMEMSDYGSSFEWKEIGKENAAVPATTAWNPFDAKTKYFEPSQQSFMFNYRVENLVELLEELKKEGVEIVGGIEEYPYGKFAWILDPDRNKIELWEPKDDGF